MHRWNKALLVALRIVVGWHFLYEGLWKIDSDTGAESYTPSSYMLQSQLARLREDLARNPPRPENLDRTFARVDAWYDEIVKAFKARRALGEDQKARLAELREKVKRAAVEAAAGEPPAGGVINFDWQYVRDDVLAVPPAPASERFSALSYLRASTGPFGPLYRALVPDMDGFDRLTVASAQAALDRRAEQILRHFASAGMPFNNAQQTQLRAAREGLKAMMAAHFAEPEFRVRLADYRGLRARVRADDGRRTAAFSDERLAADRQRLDEMEDDLLSLETESLAELAAQAQTIATPAQLGAGPFPKPAEPVDWINFAMRWGLVAMGACLLAGLFTPVAALAAAAQLAVFYFASPPWPGMPAATLGGHYLYVDRNLIEMFAAAVVATSGAGRWAGLDAYVARWWPGAERGGKA
jgi:uncharacterized membrane protein YphA (DoxX/SURF4 family)